MPHTELGVVQATKKTRKFARKGKSTLVLEMHRSPEKRTLKGRGSEVSAM